uniref:Uncharacterized protein n=1 Tax=Entomoneis paludosa TaxID=265537 RepID=A0A7S2V8D1_9STRA|mmetsp:Transcript_11238/g.22997  ORF Transcript_11238/g.22997 Transcript_11238/m.22997 type:complete len:370 (+) Transcript_11238:116-1225(+)
MTFAARHFMRTVAIAVVGLLLVGPDAATLAFSPIATYLSPSWPQVSSVSIRCGNLPLHAKRKKESMAQKRARRNSKQRREVETAPSRGDVTTLFKQEDSQKQVAEREKASADAAEVTSKAQQLLDRQKESISFLSLIREAVERLDAEQLSLSLREKGYFVVDKFLSDESLLNNLQKETLILYEDGNVTQLDTSETALGFSGEFITALKGGENQYQSAPRSVEWVVGMTKHMPSKLEELDSSNCMAFLRTYDRDARSAARKLFFGEDKQEENDRSAQDEPTCSPFGIEASDKDDMRYLTLRYYLVSNDWDPAAGALRFEITGETIQAKSDRLVIYKSKETMVQKDAWFLGQNDQARGNCIELHLIQKKEE